MNLRYKVPREFKTRARPSVGLFFCPKLVMHMDAAGFVFMCGTIASHHDTAMAHAMLHSVAVWAEARGVRGTPGGLVDIPARASRHRGGK